MTSGPIRTKETPQARRQRIRKIVQILEHTYPDARLALDFKTPLELLIALILAAQCRDTLVNQVTARLFKKYRTPQDWVKAAPKTLEAELRGITFYRNKAKAIQACCRELTRREPPSRAAGSNDLGRAIARFGGKVPDRLEDLLSLPGVGRKTANILRGNAYGQPAIGVDRHVGRLALRLGLTTEDNPDKIEEQLNPVVPDDLKIRFCYLLQAHGRAICLARKPDCPVCPINRLCPYPAQMKIPLAAPRRA
jgi:endonuclease-3